MNCFKLFLFKIPILTEILHTLRVPYEVTIATQNASFTLSDFYGCWLKIERQLKKMVDDPNSLSEFAQTLAEKIANRKATLLNNQAMICAVYLDPRFKFKLTANEIEIARTTLENLFERVKNSEGQTIEPESSGSEDSFEDECVGRGMQRTFHSRSKKKTTGINFNAINFKDLLDSYEKTERCHHKDSIFEFWLEVKDEHAELYLLACIIFAIPPSQATVERAFSILGYIYDPKRTNLAKNMLENILMINLNKDMVDPINERDMEALKKRS